MSARKTTSSHLAQLALLSVAACDRPEPRFEFVDRPSPAPPQVDLPDAKQVSIDDPPEGHSQDEGDTCTRGTGRDAQGVCRRLATRDLQYVERVALPTGSFVMGDVPTAYDAAPAREDARPRWPGQPPRRADVQGFWIDLHEVTREAYGECVEAGKCTPATCPDGRDATQEFPSDNPEMMPQTCVSHEQARAFCSAHDGRLPTEVEWEYAARGVDARIYPWGNQINDQLLQGLGPVTSPKVDVSYFGIRGMGINALEWAQERYESDAALSPFLAGSFRSSKGPHRRAAAKDPPMHVVKGGRAGARRAAAGPDVLIGFRCAADLSADDTELTVPASPPQVPSVRPVGDLWVFGGVAETVNHSEAKAFCAALALQAEGRTFDAWRLPTADEVRAVAQLFRGPGPFWTADGAVVQQASAGARAKPSDPWVEEPAELGEPLAARCIHD
jgi:formylglycine-generating enzyme required for sulfatase activity